MSRPKKRAKKRAKKRPASWNAVTNAHRKRPQRLITMSPEGWAELDRRRGDTPIGRFMERLLGVAAKK